MSGRKLTFGPLTEWSMNIGACSPLARAAGMYGVASMRPSDWDATEFLIPIA